MDGIKPMNNLKITSRLGISIVFLLLALAIILHAYIGTISSHIEIAGQEKKGLAYMRPLMKTLDALGDQHMLKSRMDGGDAKAEGDIKAATKKVDDAFAEVEAADKRYGEALEFTPSGLSIHQHERLAFAKVLKKWHGIADAQPKDVSDAQYDSLTDDLHDMVAHINETSMLMSDPDLYTVYLMEATMMVLPDSLSRIAQGQGPLYHALATHKPLDYQLKERALVLTAFLEQNDVARVNADMRITYNQLPTYYGTESKVKARTEGALAEYDRTSKAFLQTLHDIAIVGTAPQAEAFVTQSQAARKAGYVFWQSCADQLDGFLQQRIDHFSNTRDVALLKASLAIAIALGFFWYVTHGIIASLRKIQHAMGEVGSGNFEYEVPCLDHKDEIGSIARTLELFRKSYWWLS